MKGNPQGTVSAINSYTQTSSGVFEASIGSSGNSQLLVGGTATLAGSLNVDLANGFQPTHGGTYQIIASSALTGTFNDGNTIVAANFSSGVNPYNNNQSAGLFDVNYSSSGVTLSGFHQIHVFSFGIDDTDPTTRKYTITGEAAAQQVSNAFAYFPGVVQDICMKRSSTDPSNASDLIAGLNQLNVNPGDTCVIYIDTHGTYGKNPDDPNDESPLVRGNSSTTSTSETELFLSRADPSQDMTARQFAAIFSTSKWADVNKLFVMDTCFSAGFWQSADLKNSYLSAIPHSAIIASAPEDSFCYTLVSDNYQGNGVGTGGGCLGQALASTIGSLPPGDLEFSTLANSIKATQDQLFFGKNGYVEGDPEDNWGIALPYVNNVDFASTPDFETGMTVAVPEPMSLLSLQMIWYCLILRRRQHR